MFKPVVIQDRIIDVRVVHDCNTPLCTTLCCIDVNGIKRFRY